MKIRLVTFLLFICGTVAFAQQPKPATAQQQSVDGLVRACNAVAQELSAARLLIESQKKELAAASDQITAEKAKSTAQADKLSLLEEQIKNLTAAIEKQDAAALLRQKEVETLQKELASVKAKLSFWRKVGAVGAGVAAVAIYGASRN